MLEASLTCWLLSGKLTPSVVRMTVLSLFTSVTVVRAVQTTTPWPQEQLQSRWSELNQIIVDSSHFSPSCLVLPRLSRQALDSGSTRKGWLVRKSCKIYTTQYLQRLGKPPQKLFSAAGDPSSKTAAPVAFLLPDVSGLAENSSFIYTTTILCLRESTCPNNKNTQAK